MKKYRCPYCGEPAFGWLQKASAKPSTHYFKWDSVLLLTCPHCKEQAKLVPTDGSRRLYKIFLPIAFAIIALVAVALVLEWWILIIVLVLLFNPISWVLDYARFKYERYVRIGEHHDILTEATIRFDETHSFIEESIYLLKPPASDIHKAGVHSYYVVAVTNCESDKGRYTLRFIKPEDHEKLVNSCERFSLFDEEKEVGTGEFQ